MTTETPTWPTVLGTLLRREDLDADAAQWAMGEIMAGDATPAQIAAFAVALRSKGETAAEMSGLAAAMLAAAHRIDVPGPAVDIVGTGGDRSHSVNISTMAALVVAGAGARVVKHGNRAASSACGTADVLEELGVVLDLSPEQVAAVGADVGITFCFAQVFHPAMRHAAAPRREIGIPTSFNFLGPLTNPAQPVAQAIGCADLRMAPVMAEVFAERGAVGAGLPGRRRARRADGLDHLVGLARHGGEAARGGRHPRPGQARDRLAPRWSRCAAATARHNAGVVRALLAGEERGPIRDAVLLNAAAALAALDAAAGEVAASLEDALAAGLARAASAVDDGSAAATLDRWVRRRGAAG